jgi:hypothetical protein
MPNIKDMGEEMRRPYTIILDTSTTCLFIPARITMKDNFLTGTLVGLQYRILSKTAKKHGNYQ